MVLYGNRHKVQQWPRSSITGKCHRTLLPLEAAIKDKEFVLVIGDSHLRSFVDGVVEMPPGRLTFGFMSTPSGDADDLRKEACHAKDSPRPPDVVCILAPSNNLTSSVSIDHAAKSFERLLRTALCKWPKLFVLDFPLRRFDVEDEDICLEFQQHLKDEYHRVAAGMGVRYLSTERNFPHSESLLWCQDRVHLSDDFGMPVLRDLIWQTSYNVLHVKEPVIQLPVRALLHCRHRKRHQQMQSSPPCQNSSQTRISHPSPARHGRSGKNLDRPRPLSVAEQKLMDIQDAVHRGWMVWVRSVAVLCAPSCYRVTQAPAHDALAPSLRQRVRWRKKAASPHIEKLSAGDQGRDSCCGLFLPEGLKEEEVVDVVQIGESKEGMGECEGKVGRRDRERQGERTAVGLGEGEETVSDKKDKVIYVTDKSNFKLCGGMSDVESNNKKSKVKRKKYLDYLEIAKAIHTVQKQSTDFDFPFWRDVGQILGWPTSNPERERRTVKHLNNIWRDNRGNIKHLLSQFDKDETALANLPQISEDVGIIACPDRPNNPHMDNMDENRACPDIGDSSNTEKEHVSRACSDNIDNLNAENRHVNTSATPIKVRVGKRHAKHPLGDEWVQPSTRDVYCFCQTPNDPKKAMIACDLCGSWYHLRCLGVLPSRNLDDIKFACLSSTCNYETLPQGIVFMENNGPEQDGQIDLQNDLPAVGSGTEDSQVDGQLNLPLVEHEIDQRSTVEESQDQLVVEHEIDLTSVVQQADETHDESGMDGRSDQTVEGQQITECEWTFNRAEQDDMLKRVLECIVGPDATFHPAFIRPALGTSTFTLQASEWESFHSKRVKGKRTFEKYSWEGMFASKVKESNPYCIIRFKNHHFSTATVRRTNKPHLTINGSCRHDSCQMTFQIVLPSLEEGIFHIAYTGDIFHTLTN